MNKFYPRLKWWQWMSLWILLLAFFATGSIAWGFSTGLRERQSRIAFSEAVELQFQYSTGLADLEAGRYDLAHQRFEYIIQRKPDFPGAVDSLARAILLSAETKPDTADVTTPTITPSPTPDTRAIDELYAVAGSQLQNQDWENLLHTLIALRDIDPHYQAVEVDRMVFLTLRHLGEKKILQDGDLEAGLYDLALSEKFVRLDSQARTYRDWAYLYQFGLSFWGIFPDKVVNYFSQLATAAPYLRDLSGIFAKDRYTMALVQYGDHLVVLGDWCGASMQYSLAKDLIDDQNLQLTAVFVEKQCNPQTATPSNSLATATATPTIQMTITLEVTPTPETSMTIESPTATQGTGTPKPSPTPEPTSTVEESPIPSETPETASL
jgi:hypothetical protein